MGGLKGWILTILLGSAYLLQAQYEYIIPRSQVYSSGVTKNFIVGLKSQSIISFFTGHAGNGTLNNGCGFDTAFSFAANTVVSIDIPMHLGILYQSEKERVNSCNFILKSSVPIQLTRYQLYYRASGAYRVLEKFETGQKYHVAYPPYNIGYSSNWTCKNASPRDTGDQGIYTTIAAFEDNTRVTITSPYCSGNGSLDSGKLQILLNRGQSYTFVLGSVAHVFPKMYGNYKSLIAAGLTIESTDSCKPIAVFCYQLSNNPFFEIFTPDIPPNCDQMKDCISGNINQGTSGGKFAEQLRPDERLSNEYLLVPNRMNRIQNPNINIRWYYRTSHYYIQTSVNNEIWLNGKRHVVPADSFLCDTFIEPIHVQAAKPVHAFTINMVPKDFTANDHSRSASFIQDITYGSPLTRPSVLHLATPPNLASYNVGNCLLIYAWNSDTVNVNGKTCKLRFKHGANYYDTLGARAASTLYTLKNQHGLSAVFMSLIVNQSLYPLFYPAGGIHSLDPVPPVWQNRIAINRPAANWQGFDDTGRAFVCRNNPARFSAETGLDSPYKVYWYLQNVLVDSGAVAHYTFTDTGSYTLRGQLIFKSPGCYAGLREENLYRAVSVYSDVYEPLPNDTLLCVGNSLHIQRSFNPRDHYRYLYNGGRLTCDTCPNQLLIVNRSNLQLRLTLTRAGCKDIFRDTLRINLRDSLKLLTTLPDTLCHGLWNGPLLRAKGGDSSAYRFELAVNARPVSLPLAVDTTFTLRLSVGDGCSAPADTMYKRIAVRPALSLQVRADTTLCHGTALQPGFTATGGRLPYTVTWFRGQNLHSDTQAQFSDTVLMAVLEDGCSSPDTAFMHLRVAPRLTTAWLAAPPARLCTDGILRFSATAAGNSGTPQWYWLRNTQLLHSDTGARFALSTGAVPASYRLVLRDDCPDSAVLAFNLLGPDKFSARWLIPDTICPNTSWTFNLHASASDSLLWLESRLLPAVNPIQQRLLSSDTLVLMQPLTPGRHHFLFSVSDACMLPDSQLHSLWVSAPPVLPADTAFNLCAGSFFDYDLSAAEGWFNRFFVSQNALPPTEVLRISDNQSLGTRYQIEVLDRCGNRDLQTVELLRLQPFTGPLLTDTALCPDEPLLILQPNASAAGLQPAAAALQWQLGTQRANFSWNTGTAVPMPGFSTPPPGLYRLRFQASVGSAVCDSLSSGLLVYPAPVAAFTANRTRTFIEDPEFLFTNHSSGANRYRWQINGSDSGQARNLRFMAGDTGLYHIVLSAFNSEGCSDTAAMQVRVVQLFRIFLPNAFTPGNDQLNETYQPQGTAIASYNLLVYNRWGQLVFRADEHNPFTGLDHQGTPLPQEVYIISAQIRSVHGDKAYLNTTVHLLR
jgi:hypothetical protein